MLLLPKCVTTRRVRDFSGINFGIFPDKKASFWPWTLLTWNIMVHFNAWFANRLCAVFVSVVRFFTVVNHRLPYGLVLLWCWWKSAAISTGKKTPGVMTHKVFAKSDFLPRFIANLFFALMLSLAYCFN